MYTTNYSVTIKSISFPEEPVTLTGDAAQAAIAQMTSHRDVDVVNEEGLQSEGNIIPYHDIDSAIIEETRTESEYTDDNAKNCTESGVVETGTLTLKNAGPVHTGSFEVMFLYDKPGTYGGIDFQVQTEGGYTFITGTIPDLQVGDSIVIDGIPANTQYRVYMDGQVYKSGVVPDEADIVRSQQ